MPNIFATPLYCIIGVPVDVPVQSTSILEVAPDTTDVASMFMVFEASAGFEARVSLPLLLFVVPS